MVEEPRPWNRDDVPPPPYFHGTSYRYSIGDELPTNMVYGADGRDTRRRCFATTSSDAALGFACQRTLSRADRDTLFLYRVDMDDPEVDTNWHNERWFPGAEPVTCVMAQRGAVAELVRELVIAECAATDLRAFCEACRTAGSTA